MGPRLRRCEFSELKSWAWSCEELREESRDWAFALCFYLGIFDDNKDKFIAETGEKQAAVFNFSQITAFYRLHRGAFYFQVDRWREENFITSRFYRIPSSKASGFWEYCWRMKSLEYFIAAQLFFSSMLVTAEHCSLKQKLKSSMNGISQLTKSRVNENWRLVQLAWWHRFKNHFTFKRKFKERPRTRNEQLLEKHKLINIS